jgi:polysaccharide export outer membrane protein
MKLTHMEKCSLYIALVVFTSIGPGCVSQGTRARVIVQPTVHATLGPGDVFEVRVFEEPDLSGAYRVDEAGKIDYPLVGRVLVAGRLPGEVAEDLTSRLRSFVKSPQVSVYVRETNSKRVTVYGQVQRPGTFPYTYPMTVSQAISLAGGFATMAAREKVRVFRIENERQVVIDVDVRSIVEGKAANQYLYPSDEVYVPDRLF